MVKQFNDSTVLPDQRPTNRCCFKVKGKFAAMKIYQGLWLNQEPWLLAFTDFHRS
jgi:hypothetical protein